MRIWWSFMCDDSHRWEAYVEETPGAPDELATCPVCGFEAVTARRELPANRARVTFVSGARVVDEVPGQVSHANRYYLEISSHDDSEILRSAVAFDWAGAVERAAWFNNVTWAEAKNRWLRTELSGPVGDVPSTRACRCSRHSRHLD
jgi:hypothetical protein